MQKMVTVKNGLAVYHDGSIWQWARIMKGTRHGDIVFINEDDFVNVPKPSDKDLLKKADAAVLRMLLNAQRLGVL